MTSNTSLVIGANGQIGKKLIQHMLDADIKVKAMIRDPLQAETFEVMGAEAVIADLETDFSFAFNGCDSVVFTAGSGANTGFDKTLLIDLWAAIKAINYATEHDLKRFIMVSSRGAENPDKGPERIKPYLVAKHAADFVLQSSDLSFTILQPGRLTDDPGTKHIQTQRPENAAEQKISRDDVAESILYCLQHDHTIGKSYELFHGKTTIAEALVKSP
jgi:uncharacterized protein YbjT (DUF2867 family)